MKAFEYQIKKTMPSTKFAARDFIDKCQAGEVTKEVFEQEGPILALQWALAKEEGRDKEVEQEEVKEGVLEEALKAPRRR